ncbi:Aminopeptidase 2 mitochondrial [Tulasnella sp. 417]|nr:Aminopeptidase 2 mitochondrial [Tulasnella sp. 417]
MSSDADYRLPTNVKPTHYDLTFKTDLEALTFTGSGVIHLDVLQETKEIVFNASADLTLSNVAIHSEAFKTEQVRPASEVKIQKDKEHVTVLSPHALPKGSKAKLHLDWDTKLTDSLTGYYYSSTQHEGKQRYYALTQFAPTDARRAFPSWDEPLLKATYDVTMISRADTVNLSNMPVTSEEPFPDATGKSWKITKFGKTPLMSTYLLCFANGHFEFLESEYTSPISGRKIPLRIYTTPDIIHQAQFSLDIKAKVMPIYEQVFQIEYPLPKLDTLVAHDFDFGAMENWGLITGRTSSFLLDPKKSDLVAQKRVASTMSHECAHSWFGDLVTMAWWDNLWLNEGFATLMGEVIIIDKIFREWKVDSEFIDAHLARALDLDAFRSSHPIEVPVPDPNQINRNAIWVPYCTYINGQISQSLQQIFDALSYSKAGSVLRMLSNYVGEETFLLGVSKYLSEHLYGNSVTKDLWEGIRKASELDIPEMMNNWVLKIGYPVVTVKESSDSITVRQDRFLATGDPRDEENETLWHIPLNVKTVDASGKVSTNRGVILSGREATIPLDTSKPFKLNAQTTGTYRVAYTPERFEKIREEAAKANSVFSLEDRMGLVSDALNLAKPGIYQTTTALDLIKSLKNEKEYHVWSVIDGELDKLNNILWEQPEEVRDNFDAFRRSLMKPLVEKLGYEYPPGDSADTIELRTLAITAAADAKDPDVIAELASRFKHFQETGDESKIPADLHRITFINAVRNGGRAEYETVKTVYMKPPTPSAKISAIFAMTGSKDKGIIEETLNFVLHDIQIQDTARFISGAAANTESRRRIGEVFTENYDMITKKFEGNVSLSNIVKYSFQYLTTEKDADALEAWFKDKDISKYNLALSQSLERIRANAKWLERCKGDVANWLKKPEL